MGAALQGWLAAHERKEAARKKAADEMQKAQRDARMLNAAGHPVELPGHYVAPPEAGARQHFPPLYVPPRSSVSIAGQHRATRQGRHGSGIVFSKHPLPVPSRTEVRRAHCVCVCRVCVCRVSCARAHLLSSHERRSESSPISMDPPTS